MKILITTEFYLPFICGITTAVLNQRQVLKSSGHEVRILTVSKDNHSYYENGVYYIRQNIPQLYKDSYATLAFSDGLLDEVYEWRPDIVHAQNEFITFIFAKKIARKCRIPLILTCHTDYPAYGIHFMKSQRIWIFLTKTFVPKIIRKTNAILCSSVKIHDLLQSYDVIPPILNIRLGLDLSGFHRKLSAEERVRMTKQIGFCRENLVFISVCRLSREKSVATCISIFKKIHERFPDTVFLIVGEGTDRQYLESYAKQLGVEDSVYFTGLIPSDVIWKYYSLADIFLNASESETQGLTFLESIASGVPVVCKDNPVNKNFLIPDVNGKSYKTEDECVELCVQLLKDKSKLQQMKLLSPDSVKAFSLEYFSENLNSLYSIAYEENWVVGNHIPANSKVFDRFEVTYG